MQGWESGSLPASTHSFKEQGVNTLCMQSQRTLGFHVWLTGLEAQSEWAAARDHLQLQSNGSQCGGVRAQLTLPSTQGLAILCPALVKHHFSFALTLAFAGLFCEQS